MFFSGCIFFSYQSLIYAIKKKTLKIESIYLQQQAAQPIPFKFLAIYSVLISARVTTKIITHLQPQPVRRIN